MVRDRIVPKPRNFIHAAEVKNVPPVRHGAGRDARPAALDRHRQTPRIRDRHDLANVGFARGKRNRIASPVFLDSS